MTFNVASPDDIRAGGVTDIYFKRARDVLRAEGVDAHVVGEIRASTLPAGRGWAILAGLDEVQTLLEDVPVTVRALREGSHFRAEEPVLAVEGRYDDFGVLETALLGLLCQASGIATEAARCKIAAGERPMYSFGARRMHPVIAPMIERSAFVGGCDGVAVEISARMLGLAAVGTMAHAYVLLMEDPCRAYTAFDQHLDKDVPRIALVDTFEDEKMGALTAARCLGDALAGVRLDTPRSRRGDFRAIIDEVRWELDLAGYPNVRIVVSGGLDEHGIVACGPHADAFGVGTAISNAPVVDFSLDLVEVDNRPVAKRGKKAGRKQLFVCEACGERAVRPAEATPSGCDCDGRPMKAMLATVLDGGRPVALPGPAESRARLLPSLLDGSLTL